MLEDTLVVFTTEFGRTPFAQSGRRRRWDPGRDHNPVRLLRLARRRRPQARDHAYGATDEIGWKAADDRPSHWHDFHATVLHLLGIDHERLTYYHNGIHRRLTNVHGHVVKPILA